MKKGANMKILINILIVCFLAINLQAVSYIYIEEGVKLPLPKQGITLYGGTPVDIISSKKDSVKVKLSGFVDKKNLYATKNLLLLLASVEDKKSINISGDKGVVEAEVPKEFITDDMEEAWENGSDLFYDKCTKCHHAKIIEHHDMLTWGALFGSMSPKAKTSKSQNELILRFLRAFAKDGILKESE